MRIYYNTKRSRQHKGGGYILVKLAKAYDGSMYKFLGTGSKVVTIKPLKVNIIIIYLHMHITKQQDTSKHCCLHESSFHLGIFV